MNVTCHSSEGVTSSTTLKNAPSLIIYKSKDSNKETQKEWMNDIKNTGKVTNHQKRHETLTVIHMD